MLPPKNSELSSFLLHQPEAMALVCLQVLCNQTRAGGELAGAAMASGDDCKKANEEATEDEDVGMLTLAWASRSPVPVLALVSQFVLIWVVGAQFPSGNVASFPGRLRAGLGLEANFPNATDVLAHLDAYGAFDTDLTMPQMIGFGYQSPSLFSALLDLFYGSPVNVGPLTTKNMTLQGISVRLRWGYTAMNNWDMDTDCPRDAPLSLKVGILTVMVLYLVRLGPKLMDISKPACKSLVKLYGYFVDPPSYYELDEQGRVYPKTLSMLLDHWINTFIFLAVVISNASLVYTAEEGSDVVLNSLALEFILEIDDQVKIALLKKDRGNGVGQKLLTSEDGSHMERAVDRIFFYPLVCSVVVVFYSFYYLTEGTLRCK